MGTYDSAIASARRTIAAKGEAVTWRKPGNPNRVPGMPWKGAPTAPTDFPNVRVAFVPNHFRNHQTQHDAGDNGNQLEKTGEEIGLMASVPFIPDSGDTVIRKNGQVLQIAAIVKVSPNGTPILYRVFFLE